MLNEICRCVSICIFFSNFALSRAKIRHMAKGRDSELIKKRDEALCRRYYYWTETQRLRFDDALRILSEQEFFISEQRIMAIIRRACRQGAISGLQPVPKVKKPRLTAAQLVLFADQSPE